MLFFLCVYNGVKEYDSEYDTASGTNYTLYNHERETR